MYNMSITSFGVLIEILLCIRGCRAEPIVSCPSGNVNVGSTVVLTCTINPAEAMTWKRDTDALANCDTFNCAVISSPGRYTFATDSGGQTVKITIAPVEPDDDNKEFTCVTSTSSESCKFSVSSTTMASTTVHTVNGGLTTGSKIAIGFEAVGLLIGFVVAILIYRLWWAAEKERLDKWRREFKLAHELKSLTHLKKGFVKVANDRTTLCELVCVLEVSSTLNKNKQLSKPKKETLARKLESVLSPILDAEVTVNQHRYTIKLPGCSLTALLDVIELIREEQWYECLREMEKTLQNTKLRTQFEEDSFRTCVANFKDLLTKNS